MKFRQILNVLSHLETDTVIIKQNIFHYQWRYFLGFHKLLAYKYTIMSIQIKILNSFNLSNGQYRGCISKCSELHGLIIELNLILITIKRT